MSTTYIKFVFISQYFQQKRLLIIVSHLLGDYFVQYLSSFTFYPFVSPLQKLFYRALKIPEISKAEALRQAQLSLLPNPQYQHPYYWSSFVLVGNWL